MNLTGALAVVTGAGSGIGRATATLLAERGARLVLAEVDRARLDDVAQALGAAVVLARQVDVGDRAAVAALAAEVHAIQRGVDVLVNNAGIGQSGGILDTPLADWDETIRVNLFGVVHGCQAFVPAMVARGRGHVVNLASVLGYHPSPRVVAYQASKYAVLGMTLSMRAELADTGVGVTAICPGMISTAIIERTRFAGERDDVRAKVAREFDRHGLPPRAVADAIVGVLGTDVALRPVGRDAWAAWTLRYAPRALTDRVGRYITKRMEKVRSAP